ncbi:hypothetical protein MtrunA17_Chr4g0074061 [Medicago truncatula]|uniref:Uncharacterized protein n=1 Tax=Medicago truncatula TaxID=3880 RepID=A0A396IH08_MEDTR|nr:hypothetical protein MtrunA17_Chr4g0074061 [Medicago truncatula]
MNFSLPLSCNRFQFSSNIAPNIEFLPAFASVVAVVSNTLPPTLNFTLSFITPMICFFQIMKLFQKPRWELGSSQRI